MKYAGIGSRKTPPDMCAILEDSAIFLVGRGWCLRSGGAAGADTAFMRGARRAGGAAEIFRPEGAIPRAAFATVSRFHPAPHRLGPMARRLHARNAQIILGENLDDPVSFVLCWTPQGDGSGGTGQGIRIANAYNIPVIDLGGESGRQLWIGVVEEMT